MIDYGQFCTLARGAEVLGELWTPLAVHELLCGSHRFNDARRGVPRMSAHLLTQRLRKFEALGVLERHRVKSGWEYHLTQAGEELHPIVVGLGHEVSVVVESTVRALTEVWTGDSDPDLEVEAGHLNVLGGGRRGQTLRRWLGRSMFAPTRMAVRP